jgi:hypothetical protein
MKRDSPRTAACRKFLTRQSCLIAYWSELSMCKYICVRAAASERPFAAVMAVYTVYDVVAAFVNGLDDRLYIDNREMTVMTMPRKRSGSWAGYVQYQFRYCRWFQEPK